MFCPRCKRLMRPQSGGGGWVCPGCGERVAFGRTKEIGRTEATGRRMAVVEAKAAATLPTADEACPKCGNPRAYWVLRQTRGADEPETRIFECTKCGHKWREYQ
jgi:DNA-directed RNA polymerase subunit M